MDSRKKEPFPISGLSDKWFHGNDIFLQNNIIWQLLKGNHKQYGHIFVTNGLIGLKSGMDNYF